MTNQDSQEPIGAVAAAGDAVNAPTPPLSAEDRHHGRLSLYLISNWEIWVKRRVETIEFLDDTSVHRHISIDFRLRSWLPKPVLNWDGTGVHYLPLALLDKSPLLDFSLCDESGRSLPLLTRRKNSAISASVLSACVQSLVVGRMAEHRALQGAESAIPLPHDITPERIVIPQGLEKRFLDLTYRGAPGQPGLDAGDVLAEFLEGQPPALGLAQWDWHAIEPGNPHTAYEANVGEPDWRWLLATDGRFRRLAVDLASNFVITVPIPHEERQRRIIKFTYRQHRAEPQTYLAKRIKARLEGGRLESALTVVEDFLEGLPAGRADEWARPLPGCPPVRSIGAARKVMRSIGWHAHIVEFNAPAIGEGGSYHLDIEVPSGLQIRRAKLSAASHDHEGPSTTQRAARSLQRVALYAEDVPPSYQGRAAIFVKPRAPTMVRGLAIAAIATFGLLLAYRLRLGTLRTHKSGPLGQVAAALLLIPGLLAGLTTRGSEHPLTTSMLFGQRVLALGVGAAGVAGAVLLVGARRAPYLATWWTCLVAFAGVLALLFAVAWRLAARRRPDGSSP
jgi:hypothetical protein